MLSADSVQREFSCLLLFFSLLRPNFLAHLFLFFRLQFLGLRGGITKFCTSGNQDYCGSYFLCNFL